jgi:opacity protein-like surface antigen
MNARMDSGVVVRRSGLRLGLALLGFVVSGLAAGQEWTTHPALTDRWSFQFGAFVPNVDTTGHLNNTAGTRGTTVSFEDDLNLTDRKAMPAILGSLRLGERWKIEAEYYSLHRTGDRAISKTINWGDNTFTAGTTVHSAMDSDIYRLSGGYSFIKDNQRELGIALGLHVTEFKTSISAAGVGANSNDVLAPLPTIGAYGAYAITPKWLLSGRADYFSLNYDEYDGSLLNLTVGIDYRFTRNIGAGLAYRYVDYEVKVTDTKFNGGLEYKFTGPVFYVTTSF